MEIFTRDGHPNSTLFAESGAQAITFAKADAIKFRADHLGLRSCIVGVTDLGSLSRYAEREVTTEAVREAFRESAFFKVSSYYDCPADQLKLVDNNVVDVVEVARRIASWRNPKRLATTDDIFYALLQRNGYLIQDILRYV